MIRVILIAFLMVSCGKGKTVHEHYEDGSDKFVVYLVDLHFEVKGDRYRGDDVDENLVVVTGSYSQPAHQVSYYNWALVIDIETDEEPDCESGNAKILEYPFEHEWDAEDGLTYEIAGCLLNLNGGSYEEPLYTSFEP
jgi:hypothetical protein